MYAHVSGHTHTKYANFQWILRIVYYVYGIYARNCIWCFKRGGAIAKRSWYEHHLHVVGTQWIAGGERACTHQELAMQYYRHLCDWTSSSSAASSSTALKVIAKVFPLPPIRENIDPHVTSFYITPPSVSCPPSHAIFTRFLRCPPLCGMYITSTCLAYASRQSGGQKKMNSKWHNFKYQPRKTAHCHIHPSPPTPSPFNKQEEQQE